MAVGGSHHCRCSSVKRYVVDRGCCMDRLCICGKETTKCGSKIARTVRARGETGVRSDTPISVPSPLRTQHNAAPPKDANLDSLDNEET